MKKIFLFGIILCFVASLNAREIKVNRINQDTLPTAQLITFLQGMNIQSYYGKPVDSFLLAIPANLYNLKVYGSGISKYALFNASRLVVDFTPSEIGPGLVIQVREFTHLSRYSPTATWDVNLFRKEKVYKIQVWKDQNTCLNGSCLE